jgi:hypothetical protein
VGSRDWGRKLHRRGYVPPKELVYPLECVFTQVDFDFSARAIQVVNNFNKCKFIHPLSEKQIPIMSTTEADITSLWDDEPSSRSSTATYHSPVSTAALTPKSAQTLLLDRSGKSFLNVVPTTMSSTFWTIASQTRTHYVHLHLGPGQNS